MKAEHGDVDTRTAQRFDVETTLVDGKGKEIGENAKTSDGDPVLPAGRLRRRSRQKKGPARGLRGHERVRRPRAPAGVVRRDRHRGRLGGVKCPACRITR
jgi:hypothetical protein